MVASVKTSESQAAVIGTEHVLATVLDAGTYQLVVDSSALVDGEFVELKIYGKARPADAEAVMWSGRFHRSSQPLIPSIPVVSPHHFKATLKQVAGTGRAFPWAVYQL